MRSCVAVVLTMIAAASLSGCAKARHIESSQQGGVVAIPANTNRWPNYYRNQAEELIRQKCPDGYEIFEERELVTGSIAQTHSRTKAKPAPTLDLRAPQYDERELEHGAPSLASVSIPLFKTEEQTDETTSYRDVTEYRISYRPKKP